MEAGHGRGIRAAAVAIILLAAFVCGGGVAAAASEVSLFVDGQPFQAGIASGSDDLRTGARPALRARAVTIAPAATESGHLASGDTLVMSLFDDASYRAIVDRLTVNVNGTYTVRARIQGHPQGYVLLSTTGNRTLGEVKVPEQDRRFALAGAGPVHLLSEVDDTRADQLESAPPLIPPWPPASAAADTRADEWTPATIDVMVVYTPAAADWADAPGNGGIANVIAQAMEKAQLVNDNSDTLLTMNLVHSAEVPYSEVNCDTDLRRLTLSFDGYMDEVHAWRKAYEADLVSLFSHTDDCGGIAWVLVTSRGQPEFGFSITRVQQAAWTYTHIHEMGHNMGLGHHKEQNFQPGPGVFPYAAGWRWVGTDSGRYCSVMTYEGGQYFSDGLDHTRVAHFSNPSIPFAGVATGHAQHGDSARTVRQTKHAVADYSLARPPWGAATTLGGHQAPDLSASRAANHVGFLLVLPLVGFLAVRRRLRSKG